MNTIALELLHIFRETSEEKIREMFPLLRMLQKTDIGKVNFDDFSAALGFNNNILEPLQVVEIRTSKQFVFQEWLKICGFPVETHRDDIILVKVEEDVPWARILVSELLRSAADDLNCNMPSIMHHLNGRVTIKLCHFCKFLEIVQKKRRTEGGFIFSSRVCEHFIAYVDFDGVIMAVSAYFSGDGCNIFLSQMHINTHDAGRGGRKISSAFPYSQFLATNRMGRRQRRRP